VLDFRAVHGVTSGEMFQADLLKPGAFQRIKYSFLRTGPRNLVCRAAADPDRYTGEIGWRLVVVIGGAYPIGVNSGQEESTNCKPAALCEHRAEKPTALRAAGKSGKRY